MSMPEREVVTIKFPLFTGEKRPRDYKGILVMTEPFVESWYPFNILTQQLITISPQVHLGLRIPSIDGDYIGGGGDANAPDPIRLYRALKILERINLINNPYDAIDLAYSATGPTLPLSHYRMVRALVRGLIGEDTFKQILQMVPPNLMNVVENLGKHRLDIDCWTLQREIRGRAVELTPVYKSLINRYERRRERTEKAIARMVVF